MVYESYYHREMVSTLLVCLFYDYFYFISIYHSTYIFFYRKSHWVNKFYYMEGAWICMALSICVIGYITREILFTSRIPVIALIIIWNMLISYCLFGIIPTYWYLAGDVNHHLELSLDILNILAKFTLPIYILIGFSTMPSGAPVC